MMEETVTAPVTQSQIEEIIRLNRVIFKLMQSDGFNVLTNSDLSMTQLKILFILSTEGPMTIGQIGEKLGVGIPAASYQVDKVVNAGYVGRAEDVADRRRTLASLTGAGEDLIRQLSQGREAKLRVLLSRISLEELESLITGLRAIARLGEFPVTNS